MESALTVTPAQLPGLLLHVAVVRPVFVWGAPGIGKSSIVRAFAESLGLECVTLVGTQLAPEDLIGVPELHDGRSRFAPPESIARTEPYCLFLDELNSSSPDVQKAFYSLILDRRIGGYELPAGSIVIGAGNRSSDNALARPMASALVNRLIHVHMRADAKDWLTWAAGNGIHPWVLDHLTLRPDHLWAKPPKAEETFSTPRSWHMLSDALHSSGAGTRARAGGTGAGADASGGAGTHLGADVSGGAGAGTDLRTGGSTGAGSSTDSGGDPPVGSAGDIDDEILRVLAGGTLSKAHASAFTAYVKTLRHRFDLEAVLKGDIGWPARPEDRDLLYYLAETFRARLVHDLPADKDRAPAALRAFAHRAKALLVELAEVSLECAQLVIATDEHGAAVLPAWFMVDIGRDLPRLVAARQ